MDSIVNLIKKELPPKRLAHTFGVAEAAEKLAQIYGADIKKCKIAALYHDICKTKSVEELDSMITRYGLPNKYLGKPKLAHSKVGAEMISRELGVLDEDIINAVKYHTTGRKNMSLIEKIVYLADMIEENRNFNGVDELRSLALVDIDRACLKSLKDTISILENQGKEIDEDTISAVKWFEKQINIL
ncbi:MAG: bis(5'-nucleosyl)-tetraphosphatase (symmetrical) YqeK [Anaerovoracaceae bacterium]